MTESSRLKGNAERINQLIPKITAEYQITQNDMQKLKRKGLIYANEHWRKGRYLYLLYPSKTGEPRRREYIGNDPTRIKAALSAIERGIQYEELNSKLASISRAIENASESLSRAVSYLERW